MRSVLLPTLLLSTLATLALFPESGRAGDRLPQIEVLKKEKPASANAADLTYRGYATHLSDIAGRKDYSEIVSALQHQVDMVENAGLSPRVLRFFRSIPIVTDELSCLANEGPPSHVMSPTAFPTTARMSCAPSASGTPRIRSGPTPTAPISAQTAASSWFVPC
jgi:hypothetical protein